MKILSLIFLALFFSCNQPQIDNSAELTNCLSDKIKLIGKIDSLENELENIKPDTIKVPIEIPVIDTVEIKDTIKIPFEVEKWDTLWKSSDYKFVAIFPDSVLVDSIFTPTKWDDAESFNPGNMIDGIPYITKENRGTRWAVSGYPHFAVFRFNEMTQIDSIEINVYGWDEDYKHSFIIYNFSDTLLAAETKSVIYSGHKIKFFGTQLVIEITGGKNSWTDIGEVKFYKKH